MERIAPSRVVSSLIVEVKFVDCAFVSFFSLIPLVQQQVSDGTVVTFGFLVLSPLASLLIFSTLLSCDFLILFRASPPTHIPPLLLVPGDKPSRSCF